MNTSQAQDRKDTSEETPSVDDIHEKNFDLEDYDKKYDEYLLKAKQNKLEDLTMFYNTEGEKIDIQYSKSRTAINKEGNEIYLLPDYRFSFGKSLSDEKEFLVASYMVAHEVEHNNSSDLKILEKAAERFETHKNFATEVANIFEDYYVDTLKNSRYPGLKKVDEALIEIMENRNFFKNPNRMNNKTKTIITGLFDYLYNNNIRGFSDLEEDTKDILAWGVEKMEEAKETHNPEERTELILRTIKELIKVLPDVEDFEEQENQKSQDGESENSKGDEFRSNIQDPQASSDNNQQQEMDVNIEDSIEVDEAYSEPDQNDSDKNNINIQDNSGEEKDEGEADDSVANGDSKEDEQEKPNQENDNSVEDNGETEDEKEKSNQEDDNKSKIDQIIDNLENSEDENNSGKTKKEGINEIKDWFKEIEDKAKKKEREEQTGTIENKKKDRRENSDTADYKYQDLLEDPEVERMIYQIEEAFKPIKSRTKTEYKDRGDVLDMDRFMERKLGSDEDRVFEEEELKEPGNRIIGIALDMSGSVKEKEAKKPFVAIQRATDIIGDDICAESFHTRTTDLIVGPNEEFKPEHLDSISTGGKTPTSLGIDSVVNLAEKSNKNKKILIVITDGKPNRSPNSNESNAVKAAAQEINEARQKGFKVIGIGVKGEVSESKMNRMFENNYKLIGNMNNLGQELLEIYKRQLKFGNEVHIQ